MGNCGMGVGVTREHHGGDGALVGRGNSALVCRVRKQTDLPLGCLFQGESEMRS